MLTPDVFIFSSAFYKKFGFDRPLYTLAHYGVFIGPLSGWLRRLGVIYASRENAAKALRSGAIVLVFPGGDYDSYRPTLSQNAIDFNGRTGYVRTAMETGVPIVPVVSIGALMRTLRPARLIAPLRPAKYLRMAVAIRRENIAATTGFAVANYRPPPELGESGASGAVR